MVQAENPHWQEIFHDPLMMPYAGQIVVRSLTEDQLFYPHQVCAALLLTAPTTDGRNRGIREVVFEPDHAVSQLKLSMRFEALGDLSAMAHLCHALLDTWALFDKDPDDLKFVSTRLIEECQLGAENCAGTPWIEQIDSERYAPGSFSLPELDETGELVQASAYEVFRAAQGRA